MRNREVARVREGKVEGGGRRNSSAIFKSSNVRGYAIDGFAGDPFALCPGYG